MVRHHVSGLLCVGRIVLEKIDLERARVGPQERKRLRAIAGVILRADEELAVLFVDEQARPIGIACRWALFSIGGSAAEKSWLQALTGVPNHWAADSPVLAVATVATTRSCVANDLVRLRLCLAVANGAGRRRCAAG